MTGRAALGPIRLTAGKSVMAQEDLRVSGIVEDEADVGDASGLAKERFDGGADDRSGLFAGITVGASGDGGESDGTEVVFSGKSEGVAVAGGEERGIGFGVAATDRADGVDYAPGRKIARTGDDRFASGQSPRKLTTTNGAALFENTRATPAVDRAVNAASAEESAVGGVDDGVDVLRGDVTDKYVDAIFEKTCEEA
jgi:hypothetical protein